MSRKKTPTEEPATPPMPRTEPPLSTGEKAALEAGGEAEHETGPQKEKLLRKAAKDGNED